MAIACKGCGQTGGKFTMRGLDENGDGIFFHQDPKCLPGFRGTTGASTFPFTTNNFDGNPVTVNSISHLRKLESAHGVACAPYSYDGDTRR